MKFVFLGTSAAEQYPALWCRCENCSKARELKGKNIRKHSCALILPDTLIDLPPGIFTQIDRFPYDLIDIKYLLVTHSHEDHFLPWLLHWRRMASDITLPPPTNVSGPRFCHLETLHVYGNESVCYGVRRYVGNPREFAISICNVQPFVEYSMETMQFIPLIANHPDGHHRALNYIIKREGKTILYALDTGWFLPETYERIRCEVFDLVVIEATFGYGADSNVHMNFRKVMEVLNLFNKDGLLKEGAPFCISHISPHFAPVHDELAPVMAKEGITVAYDGMEITL